MYGCIYHVCACMDVCIQVSTMLNKSIVHSGAPNLFPFVQSTAKWLGVLPSESAPKTIAAPHRRHIHHYLSPWKKILANVFKTEVRFITANSTWSNTHLDPVHTVYESSTTASRSSPISLHAESLYSLCLCDRHRTILLNKNFEVINCSVLFSWENVLITLILFEVAQWPLPEADHKWTIFLPCFGK